MFAVLLNPAAYKVALFNRYDRGIPLLISEHLRVDKFASFIPMLVFIFEL